MTFIRIAASAAVRVIGPTWATVPNGLRGKAGTLPKEGLSPKMPEKPAGMRIEPPPSVPSDKGAKPAATAAAEPPDDPPGVFDRSQGLRVTPDSGELVTPFQPNSGVVVLPRRIAPCSRSRAAAGPSSIHGCSLSTVREPRKVGQPLVRMRSLTTAGTPST